MMSRSGYHDEVLNQFDVTSWRGQVASALRGKRGQKLLLDLVHGLDAMPEKRLISEKLQCADGMCALGVVGARRGIDLLFLNPTNNDDYGEDKTAQVAGLLDIADQLALEIVHINDEHGRANETPEQRWKRVRKWAAMNINYVFEDLPEEPTT